MIELKNLTKIYHSAQEGSIGLKNISIKFPEVGFVALTGQSGSGKTTMLMVLSGFQSYEEGDLLIDGVDALSFQEEDWQNYQKKDIGFIFQDYGLLESYTVIDNIVVVLKLLGLNEKESFERAHKYLKIVHLDDLANRKVITLSSGQKQRLAIARAIAKEPRIILCDEPTANLDRENSMEIMKILGEISKKCLVITSTHNYEDAKGYANYFIRLYKGSLISFDVVSEPNNSLEYSNEVNKPNPFAVFKTYLKNRKIRYGITNFFIIAFSLMIFVLLSVFLYNLDDGNTRILSKEIFNNINNNELIIMRHDEKTINEEDLEKIKGIKRVEAYEKYGLATDMNYYYRENIDFRYDHKIIPVQRPGGELRYENVEVFNKFNKSLFVKSYVGKITQDDLKSGSLPTNMFDVVASSDYTVGDEIEIYFDNPATISSNEFNLKFRVSGILKEKSDDLYFSDDFTLQVDFLQKVAFNNEWILYINYNYQYVANGAVFKKTVTLPLIPLYIGDEEEGKIWFSKSYINSFNSDTGFPVEKITSCYITTSNYIRNVSPVVDTYYDVPLETKSFISGRFVIVSKNVYEALINDYQSPYAKVYVEEYPYVSDVIKELYKLGYDVMSPYLASSAKFDEGKVSQRSNALIIAISSIFATYILLLAFYLIIMQMKKKEEKVMLYQGASKDVLNKFNFIDLMSSAVFSLIISVIIYLIFKNSVDYLKEAYKYVRFYHFIIAIGLVLIITFFATTLHNRSLSLKKAKGGE